jgi:hypothetical protein
VSAPGVRALGRPYTHRYPPPVVTHVASGVTALSFRLSFRPSVAGLGVLALVATLAVATPPPDAVAQTPTFSDLDQTIHAEAIELVAADGIAGGFPDGTFRPRNDVRRDQMATFLANALRLDEVPSIFPDVPAASPHFGRIGAIADARITQGFPDGTYRPLGNVTRGQMARFLAEGFDLPPGDKTFDDVPAGYVHADAIARLASSGITSGYPDGTFRPNLPVKRDQMARFLANAVPLPRDPCAVPGGTVATASRSPEPTVSAESRSLETGSSVDSEDLRELRAGGSASPRTLGSSVAGAEVSDLGHAVPGIAFPLTSAIRTSVGSIEVHSQDLSDSRGARVEPDGSITATTRIPAGTRTWAAAERGGHVYVGQWGTGTAPNLFRYPIDASAGAERVATPVATLRTGNEFWGLAADDAGRLWAGTRGHLNAEFREQAGLKVSGIEDPRHVVHRVDQLDTSEARVVPVVFGAPNLPTTAAGQRPDVKQVDAHDETLYVGLGQQANGARLYAFAPGDRREVPQDEVRDLTPASVRSATSIFTLQVTDDHIALGTEGTTTTDARLVVLDRASEQVLVDVALDGERRVDAIGLADGRVVATVLTGRIYEAAFPTEPGDTDGGGPTDEPVVTTADVYDAPLPGQFSRYVELDGATIRGITNRGLVWTRSPDGDVDVVNLVDTGAPVDAGLPHSLHVGTSDVVVGSTSAVTLRSRAAQDPAPRTVALQGEAKAVTSAPSGDSYVATYPNAQLWRIEAGGDIAETLQGWTGEFTRPAGAVHDPRRNEVHIIAREEGNQVSEEKLDECGRFVGRFQYRASRLFSISTVAPGDGQAPGKPLLRPSGRTVEASSLAVGSSGGRSQVFVGDTRGGVQRVDAVSGSQAWYAEPDEARAWRRVVAVELIGGRLVVTTAGNVVTPEGNDTRTIIDERDPATGQLLRSQVISNVFIAGDAASVGNTTVLTRRSDIRVVDHTTWTVTARNHASNASFGGPYAAFGADCELYHFAGVPSHLVRRTDVAACG